MNFRKLFCIYLAYLLFFSEMTKYSNITTCSTVENSVKYDILLEVNSSPKLSTKLKDSQVSPDSGLDLTAEGFQQVRDFTMQDVISSVPNMTSRITESHGESTAYQTVDEKRNMAISADVPRIITPTKRGLSRSVSRRHRRSDSTSVYELSSDLKAMALECLENKYGGKERSNKAARIIQQYYRHWVLNRSFLRMRSMPGRRRSITMPEKHFEKLKQSTLVFYGPENPVMIVDDNVEDDSLNEEKGKHELLKRTETLIETAVEQYPDNQDSVSTDSGDSDDVARDMVDQRAIDDFETDEMGDCDEVVRSFCIINRFYLFSRGISEFSILNSLIQEQKNHFRSSVCYLWWEGVCDFCKRAGKNCHNLHLKFWE